jgi:hypothetical protein
MAASLSPTLRQVNARDFRVVGQNAWLWTHSKVWPGQSASRTVTNLLHKSDEG